MPKLKINFTRKEHKLDTTAGDFTLKTVSAIDNQVWTMCIQKPYSAPAPRSAQGKVRDLLNSKFSSINFFSPSSVYFYFTDEADEAEFMFWASSDDLEIDI